jgi:putative membrane protein
MRTPEVYFEVNKMEQILSNHDRVQLDERIVETEKRTNTQIVLAAVKRSDSYVELPWKAFALGASIAGLLTFSTDLVLSDWVSNTMVLVLVVAILAAGAVFSLLTVFIHPFARLFLSAHRAETEVRQYAEALFLSREMFATSGRTGILMLISLFERHVVILPDKGLTNRLTSDVMQNIIKKMSRHLARNEVGPAMEVGLEELAKVLESSAPGLRDGRNELSNEIIEEKGV